MKLIELVQKYKGEVTFDVNCLVDDSPEDVVVFREDEVDAIKDEIINAEVAKFSVANTTGTVPVLKVLVRPAEAVTAPETPATPDTPTEGGGEATEGETATDEQG